MNRVRFMIVILAICVCSAGCAVTHPAPRKKLAKVPAADTSHGRISYFDIDGRPLAASDSATLPIVIRRAKPPEFPDSRRLEELMAFVTAKAWVDTSGRVESVEVLTSDAEIFNEPTVRIVHQWLFSPPTRNHHPMRFIALMPFKYVMARVVPPE